VAAKKFIMQKSAEQRIAELDCKIAINAARAEHMVFLIKRFLAFVIIFAIIAGVMALN
jgi:hypothetical protein